MSNEMIERVAFATCTCKPCICRNKAGFTGMPCLERGRAAIEAMCEPNKTMIRVGHEVLDEVVESEGSDSMGHWHVFAPSAERRIWEAMIDAALKEV